MNIKIFIPGHFMNWNDYINKERTNKYIANNIKQREKKIVADAVKKAKIKPYEGDYPCKVIIYPHFKNKRKDLDNTRYKGVIDGLVACGVIKNDNLNHIQHIEIIPVFDDIEAMEIEIKGLDDE